MTASVVMLDAGRRSDGGGNAGDQDVALEGIRALGYQHERYYYLSPITQQIVELAAGDHSEPNLCRLRELEWWAEHYPPSTRQRTTFDIGRARQALMDACHRIGIFEPDLVRGRGVWWDDDRGVVFHAGQWVHAGAAAWRPSDAPMRHIYEAAGSWSDLAGEPLDDDGGRVLLEVLERLRWAEPTYARLMAGWLVVAPVSGALRWRPHIALTGPRDTGKSFIANAIMRSVLGPICLHVEGETTAAGLRQTLGRDARPIVWDEAEPQGQRGAARLQEAIGFARSLSTSDSGAVVKGGANHRARSFAGVGVMCLISIFGQLQRDSDASRFTILELLSRRGHFTAESDAETRRMVEQLDPEFSRRLLARTMAHLGALRESHEVFAQALVERWGTRRLGDQLGALLAGAHLLANTEPITIENARAQVAELPEVLAETPVGLSDEERCLQQLSAHWARCDTHGGKRQITRTLGDLIGAALRNVSDEELAPAEARAVLARHGVKVRHRAGEVAVAVNHPVLANLYRDTDFAGGWARMLERMPGARRSTNAVRFGAGVQGRATVLPGEVFAECSDPDAENVTK